ncbi:MAG: L,D-transpeptidase family protein [Myxococcaceae bacterium]|nr:L,D-transpeptidase family protein [Myxococcaceae bacterium]
MHPLALVLLSSVVLANARVEAVRKARADDVKKLLTDAGLPAPVDTVYLRAFKEEKVVELWAGKKGAPLSLVKSYPVCAASGELGPKRKEGDLQVPEGLYEISEFNPGSNFHLSMKVSYPNASDRVRSDARRPGGLIYLHGNCASIGCIAIEDAPIEEVYLIALDAKTRPIRIDVFPARLTPAWLSSHTDSEHAHLWKELEPAYRAFEATKRPAPFSVGPQGVYRVKEPKTP